MLHFLPKTLLGVVSTLLVTLNTIFWTLLLYPIALLRLLIPIPLWQRGCYHVLIGIAETWIACNDISFRLTQKTQWDIQGLEGLRREGRYLIIPSHQSWVDIFVIQHTFNRRIPFQKFFLKKQLIWFPLLGLAWWALDFPFMHRYTREQVAKSPKLKGKDLEVTRKACEKFKDRPVSILNFLEGSRSTPEKLKRQQSPYRHLLKPKAGGMAFVLGAMGDRLDSIIDMIIIYHKGKKRFWDLMSGQIPKITVRVKEIAIPPQFVGRDYLEDPNFQETFQAWVRELWKKKDDEIHQLLQASSTT
ncbi:MAG: acyltransferase [Deltaproteobacteria bacterium RIFCSPLOWO2_02_FULL_50_16]|nr:MAG: acyltransferase [Deltaproteobacteria bacterium GWA2_50_8]OGQ25758.1 MAG: acyltransferase [Deltaproteobacteria bacterium RIFCSPHIGHO2_02_FULL_50_15]OGQ57018.1 MAG: acyltransferase [Deltaproteobacteria bacterium RIFCSPLOWO2_02_FULL_50_16]OGQ68667.1 MAG: acyltransferase [Deltaproteobacteria bacterium RIFCSPLOWO2_12_FULL_50_11]